MTGVSFLGEYLFNFFLFSRMSNKLLGFQIQTDPLTTHISFVDDFVEWFVFYDLCLYLFVFTVCIYTLRSSLYLSTFLCKCNKKKLLEQGLSHEWKYEWRHAAVYPLLAGKQTNMTKGWMERENEEWENRSIMLRK